MGAALAHARAALLLWAGPAVEDEEKREGELGEPAEAVEERAELGGDAAVLVLAAGAVEGMGQPDAGVDAEAEGAGAVRVVVEAVDDGELGEGAGLAGVVQDLGVAQPGARRRGKRRTSQSFGTPIGAEPGGRG